MIWKIAKKEFLQNLMTFKFAVGTILCVVLMAVFMPVLIRDYQERLKNYNENVVANESELRKVKIYKNIMPTVYRRPNLLSVFSEGLDKQVDNSATIGIDGVGVSGNKIITTTDTNPLLSIFPILDISLIFKIMVSVLAILMAYNVISGEREGGTLKLMLSSEIPRYQVLLGKVLAGLMTLIVPMTVSFILGLLFFLFSPVVDLTGSDWIRIGLIYFASLIFISAMFNLGLLVSCCTRRPAVSLVFGLFIWVIFVALVPNTSVYIASQLKPSESAETFDRKIKAVIGKHDNEINELTKGIDNGGNQSNAPGAFNQIYVMVCDTTFKENHQKIYPITEPVKIRYVDKILEVKQIYLNNLISQKRLSDNIACCSPMVLYENLISALAGTDLGRYKYFTNNVKIYRNEVMHYIASKTANFSSPSYFTTSKEGDHKKLMELYLPYVQAKGEAEKAKQMKVLEDWYNQTMKQTPSLGLHDFPQFVYPPQSITESLRRIIPSLGLLLFINALFFAVSFVAFLKYDVR